MFAEQEGKMHAVNLNAQHGLALHNSVHRDSWIQPRPDSHVFLMVESWVF